MKQMFLATVLLAFISLNVSAQKLHLGVKAGANLGKIDGSSFKEEFNLSYHAGAFLSYDFTEKWGIQPELLYSQTKVKTANSKIAYDNLKPDFKAKLDYLYIPVLVRYNFNNLLTLHAGPQFGILTSENASFKDEAVSAFKSGDVSGVLGLQLNLRSFNVYGRYNLGLQNIKDVGEKEKWKSQTLQLGVGYNIL